MNTKKRVMLLIDADNVSTAVIEQALARVQAEHGAAHLRRAYCTAETALAQQKFFKTHAIRPIVNLSNGKNANDIALAIDAMDLAISERPDVAVIVSSDSDFAPLVIRLREKGCRVEGIGQQGKTGEDTKPVYDSFVELSHKLPQKSAPRGGQRGAQKEKGVRATEPKPAPVVTPQEAPAQPAAKKSSSRRRRPAAASAAEPVATPPQSAPVPATPAESAPDKPARRARRSRR